VTSAGRRGHLVQLWPLALIGLVLEGTWVGIAALSSPLTKSDRYTSAWTASLGPLSEAFAWLVPRLEALVPAAVARNFEHGPAFASFLVALLVASVGYLLAIWLAASGARGLPGAVPLVVAFALLFQLTLWCMPGILTTDLASYALYGRIGGVYGSNPYLVPPETFASDPLLPWIASGWWGMTSLYGPLWLDLSWLVARVTGGLEPIGQVLAYRLLVNLSYVASLGVTYWLLGRLAPSWRFPGFVAFAWSPVLLLQVAGNGHNDGVGVLLVLLGFACLAYGLGRTQPTANFAWIGALTLFALATLLKLLPAFTLLFCAVAWARVLPSHMQRLRWLGGSALWLASLTLLLARPWLVGLTASGHSVAGVGEIYAHSVLDVPAAWLATHVLDRNGQSVLEARQMARALVQVPASVLFAILVAWEARRVWQLARLEALRAIIGASTRAFLASFLLVSTQVQPWYFSWPTAVGVLVGWRDMTARVAVAYGLLFALVAYLREDTGQSPIDPLLIAYAVLPLLLPAAAWAGRRPLLLQARAALRPGRVRA
jgi:hypothetical protein